jgi:hypothetical protein
MWIKQCPESIAVTIIGESINKKNAPLERDAFEFSAGWKIPTGGTI